MMDILDAWKYTDRVNAERCAALSEPGSFDNVVRLVTEDVLDIRVRAEPGRAPGLTNCIQPVFTLEIPNVGDALFNGPWGYRAQYWVDPGNGLAANTAMLAALAPKLLEVSATSTDPVLTKIDVSASLHAVSAKIWMREILSLLQEGPPDLDVERWVVEAEKGVDLARSGLLAPRVTAFEVKGALMDPHGNEVVPSRKLRRHYDIHNYGFS